MIKIISAIFTIALVFGGCGGEEEANLGTIVNSTFEPSRNTTTLLYNPTESSFTVRSELVTMSSAGITTAGHFIQSDSNTSKLLNFSYPNLGTITSVCTVQMRTGSYVDYECISTSSIHYFSDKNETIRLYDNQDYSVCKSEFFTLSGEVNREISEIPK